MSESQLYKYLKIEMAAKGKVQKDLSKHIGKIKTDEFVWRTVRDGRIRIRNVIEFCKFLGLELTISNPRKKGAVHIVTADDINLFKCFELERKEFSKLEVASLISTSPTSDYAWQSIKSLNTQWRNVVTICDALGLEIHLKKTEPCSKCGAVDRESHLLLL